MCCNIYIFFNCCFSLLTTLFSATVGSPRHNEFHCVVDNLNPTEDGEAGEEPHGATDEAELGLQGHLHIPLNLIIGGGVEVNLDQF